jgi:hypothetical protein
MGEMRCIAGPGPLGSEYDLYECRSIADTMMKAKSYTINVILKDYSKGSLVPDGLILNWHVQGDKIWKTTKLSSTGFKDQYSASIPGNQANITIEYYVEAKSNWGTHAMMPRTAPRGFTLLRCNRSAFVVGENSLQTHQSWRELLRTA